MLIDSHAHLTNFEDVDSLIERASLAGVDTIINICTNPAEVERGLILAKKFPWIYNAAATTPHDAEKEGSLFFAQMEDFARNGALVAVGETGLDYHYYSSSKEQQQELLCKYLVLAKECSLPVIIHCREAFADLLRIIDSEYKGLPGVLHCFTGTLEEAELLIQRGWYISFSGIVTFKKSQELQAIAKVIPKERLLIETDAPYLAPISCRGKINEPAYLVETANFIATLRGVSLEELAETTAHNARTLFSL